MCLPRHEQKTYRGIRVQHEVLDITVEPSIEEGSFWDLFVSVSSLVTVSDNHAKLMVSFFFDLTPSVVCAMAVSVRWVVV